MLVADKRRKDPRTLPRPWEKSPTRPKEAGLQLTGDGGMVATGLDGMLAAAQMRGAVNIGG